MRSTSYQSPSTARRDSARRRVVSIALAILAHLLVILVVIWLSPSLQLPKPPPKPVAFQMLPDPAAEATHATPSKTPAKSKRPPGGGAPKMPVPRVAPPPAAKPSNDPSTAPLKMLIVGKDVFAAADIAGLPSHHGDPAPAGGNGQGDGKGNGEGSDDGAGDGPGGARLYNAEWYREPTAAQLAFYLPRTGAPPGWAEVACHTIANYHVDQCRELGESPPGSGLARAVRQAAWQFQVLPPRVGGHMMVGAWVRIRYTFTQRDPQ